MKLQQVQPHQIRHPIDLNSWKIDEHTDQLYLSPYRCRDFRGALGLEITRAARVEVQPQQVHAEPGAVLGVGDRSDAADLDQGATHEAANLTAAV